MSVKETKQLVESGRAVRQAWPRRQILKLGAAIGSGTFARTLLALAEEKPKVTEDMVSQAEWISGIRLTDAQRKSLVEGLSNLLAALDKLRGVAVDNSVPPALLFDPSPSTRSSPSSKARAVGWPLPRRTSRVHRPSRPGAIDDLAFMPVSKLAALVRSRQVSSIELTRLYLDRLRRLDPTLKFVVTFTEELALRQAEQADREISAGRYRGPLHGIPWGAKDLLAVPGYRTTWGAKPYENQVRPEKAAVVERLEAAGAVLVAKLTLGELAQGDVWFGGMTRNPWNPKQGSSGSSAGPASATAAGAVGFAMGSETLGSIVSPCTRCGVTGLRPTFGRVSRYGAMALAWSMDKLGPIARSAEDCALVFEAIHGTDSRDPTAVNRPFHWPYPRDPKTLRVGFLEAVFEEDRAKNVEKEEDKPKAREWQEFDKRTLEVLRRVGFKLVPVKLPEQPPAAPLRLILTAEAAASFDDLTRSGRDSLLALQDAWPKTFRGAQMIPAVEYLRANRIRTMLMREMAKLMSDIDVYVSPSFGGGNLLITNLTGNPAAVVPNGFHASDGTPTSITFMGKLYGESETLAVAHAYQQATDFHLKRPPPPVAPEKG